MDKLDTVSKLADSLAKKASKKTARLPRPILKEEKPVNIKNIKGKYSVGFASRNITPDNLLTHTYWMAGYNIAKSIKSLLDPLTANAMWLGVDDIGGVMLLSCDLIGLTGYELQIIREHLGDFCRLTGCKNVTVSCTHTHAGIDTMGYWGVLPKSGKDKAYMEMIINTLTDLCMEAYINRKPGKLYYGNTEAPELIDRWREPYFSNNRLHRFRFVPDDGTKETWYVNFGAHPNTLGGKNRSLSADYPAYMRREINKTKDTNIMFSVSTIGATDIGNVDEDNFKRTVLGGEALGRKVLSIEDSRELKPDITVFSKEFIMPIENKTLLLANKAHVFNARICSADSSYGIGFVSEITYFSFDGIEILTMPGEMFSELVYSGGYCDADSSSTGEPASVNSQPLCEIMENDNLIIFGVTNDMAGYALARNDFVLHKTQPYLSRGTDRFGRSHYHETNSCGINTGDVIANTCREIKAALK